MFIRTDRLLIRPSWPDDLDEFVALLNDEGVARNIGVRNMPDSAKTAEEIISRPRDKRLPYLFIHLRDDDGLRLIGGIGFGQAGEDVELGYWIARAYWGRGYASEAVKAVMPQAWILGHKRIIAVHFDGNEATDKVLQKAGFRSTGETVMRYSEVRGCKAPATKYVAERPDRPAIDEPATDEEAVTQPTIPQLN